MNLLVVVDMQNDFIDGALGTREAEEIVPAVAARIQTYRARGDMVVFTRDTHTPQYMDTQEGQLLPVPHCIRGTHGWEISDQLLVEDSLVIDKPTFGAVNLGVLAARLQPETIEVCGLCTDICVISNALLLKAFLPETPITVDPALCAGVTPQSHLRALECMKSCQIHVKESFI